MQHHQLTARQHYTPDGIKLVHSQNNNSDVKGFVLCWANIAAFVATEVSIAKYTSSHFGDMVGVAAVIISLAVVCKPWLKFSNELLHRFDQ